MNATPLDTLRRITAALLLAAVPVLAHATVDPALQRKAYLAEELAAAKSEFFYLVFDKR